MDDLISREYVRAKFDYISYAEKDPITIAKRIVDNAPSAERRGRWEDVEHAPNGLLYATCSVCGKRQTVEAVNYCGNCGARMEV